MQALQGLKVVEVGNIVAGPFCGTLMADFGAEVIKVEPPKGGDLMRNMGRISDMWFSVEGRNKKTVTLDLRAERGKELLTSLLKDADVLIENFRPGAFARLGFPWEKLREINPRLIYACSSGYGRTGPKSHLPGMDRIGLAAGGFLQVTGFPDSPPVKPGISTADFFTAMFACTGVMFAIYSRDVLGTGQGQMIDCCLTDSVIRLQESILAEYAYDGTIRERIGNSSEVTVPSGHFPTKDGQYLVMTVSGDKLFALCCQKIGREDLLSDPRYEGQTRRAKYREELNQIVAEWAAERTVQECLDTLGSDIPCTKVYNVADIFEEEQFRARNMIIDVMSEKFGMLKMQNVVPGMSDTPGQVNWAGPPLGKFNREIYCDRLGLSAEELDKLQAEGVI
ncbi:MAG: CoA transferase [Synergistaceae bacterium]|jgi:crotonobetainyl-CoA:carnitine CoA-transferase CaiB-like acyl-CoA transferase|nr:CoA transferase [Synergistaceae bacterium]